MKLFNWFQKKTPRPAASELPASNLILSCPKSGRTWLRVMIGRVFVRHFGLSDEMIFDERTMTEAAGLPVAGFSHDGTSNSAGVPLDELETDKRALADRNILLLVRDPRDVVVSCFFQATRRKSRFEGDISSFIRTDTHGIRKIIHFYNIWDKNRSIPKSFSLLRYEDMHHKPHASLRTALHFLGVDDATDEEIQEAVEFAAFEKMQKMESDDNLGNKKLRPGNKRDPESFKVRKGKIGGYEDYLSTDDIKYCNDMMEKMHCPFGYR
jgi:hypothetical protein